MATVNTYNYIRVRKADIPLPKWMHVTITAENGTKWLTVHSRHHIGKVERIAPNYSLEFTDREILADRGAEVARRWL